jgi:hypothetical protein
MTARGGFKRIFGKRTWLAVPLLVAMAGTAAAAIIQVGLMAVFIAPPPSVVPGMGQAPNIWAFNEQQDVVLPFAIPVDAHPGDFVDEPGDLTPGWIPQGTCVSSHYLRYDPVNVNSAQGRVRFDREILGVALRPLTLDATNFLGAAATNYPPNAGAGVCNVAGNTCAMELPGDVLRVGPAAVEVDFTAADPGDRIRVITKGCCEWWCPASTEGDVLAQ